MGEATPTLPLVSIGQNTDNWMAYVAAPTDVISGISLRIRPHGYRDDSVRHLSLHTTWNPFLLGKNPGVDVFWTKVQYIPDHNFNLLGPEVGGAFLGILNQWTVDVSWQNTEDRSIWQAAFPGLRKSSPAADAAYAVYLAQNQRNEAFCNLVLWSKTPQFDVHGSSTKSIYQRLREITKGRDFCNESLCSDVVSAVVNHIAVSPHNYKGSDLLEMAADFLRDDIIRTALSDTPNSFKSRIEEMLGGMQKERFGGGDIASYDLALLIGIQLSALHKVSKEINNVDQQTKKNLSLLIDVFFATVSLHPAAALACKFLGMAVKFMFDKFLEPRDFKEILIQCEGRIRYEASLPREGASVRGQYSTPDLEMQDLQDAIDQIKGMSTIETVLKINGIG